MPHIPESRIYFQQLKDMCKGYQVEDMIDFIISPSEEVKFTLYRQCDSALYTPPNEHFGIVPIEALEQRRPVIVINSGGPAETVLEGVTGTKVRDRQLYVDSRRSLQIDYPSGELLAKAMIEHMERKTWEHLDEDVLFEKQVTSQTVGAFNPHQFKQERFVRDFSLEGFGARIDEAVLRMFPDRYLPRQPNSTSLTEDNQDEERETSDTVVVLSSLESKLPQKHPKLTSQRNSLRHRA